MTHIAAPAFNSAAASKVGVLEAVGGGGLLRVAICRSVAALPQFSKKTVAFVSHDYCY
jgi:hypothetical protein